MLPPPTRPRAPSAATLRVLYQLAYISSGTAVGIGALCAEERRRRTQIVQRVADNARRIRQSPRYARGAAALAVREQADFEDEVMTWRPEGVEREDWEGKRLVGGERRGGELSLGGWEGAKMPELPSVVEEEYGITVERSEGKGRKRRRVRRSGTPEFVEEHRSREPVGKRGLDRRKERPDQPSIRHLAEDSELQDDDVDTNGSTILSGGKPFPLQWISYQRPEPKTRPNKGQLKPQEPRRRLFHGSEKGRAYRNPEISFERVAKEFGTRHLWDASDFGDKESLYKPLSKDVNLFFDKVHVKSQPRMEMQHACRIANNLLRLCYDSGAVNLTRSLHLWKIATNELNAEDLSETIKLFPNILTKMRPGMLVQYYSDLFATEAYRLLPPSERMRLDLRLRAEALKMDEHPEQERPLDMELGFLPYGSLIGSISIPPEMADQGEEFGGIVGQECRLLVEEGHLSPAINLWCMAMEAQGFYRKTDAKLDKELFDAALKARHLSLCVRMLRFKQSRNLNYQLRAQKDDFIRVCFDTGGTGLLRSLFDRRSPDALGHNKLSTHSYMCLARCFAETSSSFETFRAYYNRVHPELRASVVENSILAKAFSLRAKWKATRNFDLVESDFHQALREFTEAGAGRRTLRPMIIAMVEVDISANRPVDAMKALTYRSRADTEGNVAALTALALAKQDNWPAVRRLLGVVEENPSMIKWTGITTRAFNNMLHLFSKAHTAHELSDLVEDAMKHLGFLPNKSTWEIMLSSFVTKKARSLLEYWLRFPRTIGSHLKLDANLAAVLMKRWYLDSRQPHQKVTYLLRYLTQVPSLRSGNLLKVMLEAIGYDFRKSISLQKGGLQRRGGLLEPFLRALDRDGLVLLPGEVENEEVLLQDHSEDSSPARDHMAGVDSDSIQSELTAISHGSEKPPREIETTTNDRTPSEDTEKAPQVQYSQGVAVSEPETSEIPTGSTRNVATSTSTSRTQSQIASDVTRQMISHLSFGENEAALSVYTDSLGPTGLPHSPIALEVAVEASLRLRGNRNEAERIMSDAQIAGMNVTCAMAPLIMDQIRHTSYMDRKTAAGLRNSVIDYYRTNQSNGLHAKHHVATMAAHAMNKAGFAKHSLNLLSTIANSEWATEHPLDITTYTVWFSGFASGRNLSGMQSIIDEVLQKDVTIDLGFLVALKRAQKLQFSVSGVPLTHAEPEIKARLSEWYVAVRYRRQKQLKESAFFGSKLVNMLVRVAKEDIEAREEAPATGRDNTWMEDRPKAARMVDPSTA